jgi:hypothetical protein
MDHAAFRRNRPNAENVIDSRKLERAIGEKLVSTFTPRASIKAVAIGAAASTLVALGAAATGSSTPYDGKWIIDATASGALCPVRSKRLGALVTAGRVLKILGLPSPQTVGFVDSSGVVTIEVKTLGVTAHIKGKLVGKTGEGEWSSNSFFCPGGGWRAAASGGGPTPRPAKPVTPIAASPISSPIY